MRKKPGNQEEVVAISAMEVLRLTVRLPVFALFLAICVATILLLKMVDRFLSQPIDRAPLGKIYMAGLCKLLGFTLRCQGMPIRTPALLVSNHVSWTDIAILGSQMPLRFLSKSEVADWPLIGWIARDIGTLFIERTAGQSTQVCQQIGKALMQGHQVLIFPEGTTTDGVRALPFRGRLLAAARNTNAPIQAITLAYRRNGKPDSLVPFVGDDCFQSHLIRLLKQPAVDVDLVFHPPLHPTPDQHSQRLAQLLHQQVSHSLEALHCKPQAPPTLASDSMPANF